MKTNKKTLSFDKIKVAKVNSFAIIGGTNPPNTVYPQCQGESRPPKGGSRTQQTGDDSSDT